MAYPIETGLQISLGLDINDDPTTDPTQMVWYKITDHNRQEIQANPTRIEKEGRMANGTLRKYVVASKMVISTSWNFIPSKTSETADGGYAAAWVSNFYSANVNRPIYAKLVNAKDYTPEGLEIANDGEYIHKSSKDGGMDIFHVFITDFSTTTVKRTAVSDYVNMNIELTEI